jgi:hypothetical protein
MMLAQDEKIITLGAPRVVGKSMKCSDCKRRSWARTAPIHNHFKQGSVNCCSILSRRSCLPLQFKEVTKVPTEDHTLRNAMPRSFYTAWLASTSSSLPLGGDLTRSVPSSVDARGLGPCLVHFPTWPIPRCSICLRPSFYFYCCWLFWPAACLTKCYDWIINIFCLNFMKIFKTVLWEGLFSTKH